MGKKYIIELEDENYHQYSDSEPSDYLWRVKGFNALVFDEVGISKLTPYTEPDLELIKKKARDNGYSEGYQDGYSRGMNDYLQNPEVKEESDRAYAHGYSDAESKFSEIRKEAYQKGLDDAREEKASCQFCEYEMCSDRSDPCRICACNYMNFFEPKKREQDAEIKIGDEVEAICGKAVVISVRGGIVYYIYPNGERNGDCSEHLKRTGRHFPEIAVIFEKMKE